MHRETFGSRKAVGQSGEITRCDQSIDAAGQTIGNGDATIWMLGDGGRPFEVVEDRDPLTPIRRDSTPSVASKINEDITSA